MDNSDPASSLPRFIQIADTLSTLAGRFGANLNPDQIALSLLKYKKSVNAVLADATPQFRAPVNRLGVNEHLLLGASGQSPFLSLVTGDASNVFDGKL